MVGRPHMENTEIGSVLFYSGLVGLWVNSLAKGETPPLEARTIQGGEPRVYYIEFVSMSKKYFSCIFLFPFNCFD